jgi:predicted esterase
MMSSVSSQSSQPNPVERERMEARDPEVVPGEITLLEVPGYLPSVLWIPGGDSAGTKPVVIATHGAYDNPESYCSFWQKIVKSRAFVICTRGKRISDKEFFYPNHLFIDAEDAAALTALRSHFGTRVAPGPVLYAGYSQGAIHGVELLQRRAQVHPRAILVEGGSRWNARTAARFLAAGGQRILFACGTPGCRTAVTRVVPVLSKAGLEVEFIWVPSAGHDYPPEMGREVAARFDWLVAGDTRWGQ